MKRNPKQIGTCLHDCIPQRGPCPNRCNQCFYNHNFYLPINESYFPTLEEVGDGIVRVNSGHDSNIQRDYVIESTKQYPKRFFNTSRPRFDFPDPVVFTANPSEEVEAYLPEHFENRNFNNLMFIRLRVSSTNLPHTVQAAELWGMAGVPVVLTFMRYHDEKVFEKQHSELYTYRTSIKNNYWCPTGEFQRIALRLISRYNSKIKMCGTPVSSFCRDCLNCEKLYYSTKERTSGDTQT